MSVTVLMVNVREMRMGMRDGLMLMAVGVRARSIPSEIMLVLMVCISRIVHVFVGMQQRIMLMPMAVALA